MLAVEYLLLEAGVAAVGVGTGAAVTSFCARFLRFVAFFFSFCSLCFLSDALRSFRDTEPYVLRFAIGAFSCAISTSSPSVSSSSSASLACSCSFAFAFSVSIDSLRTAAFLELRFELLE